MKKKQEKEIFHTHNHNLALKRIKGFYGKVMREQNKNIIGLVKGETVLDVGAGYGALTKELLDLGYKACGIEPDPEMIEYAKKFFSLSLLDQSIYQTTFSNNSFDTIILREILPHLDFKKAVLEISRILKDRLIIFDSVPNLILKLSRLIIGHREYKQKPLSYYLNVLKENGYEICKVRFRDIIAFPLSGAYIGPCLLPEIGVMEKAFLRLDKGVNYLLKKMHLQRQFCWRVLIEAKKSYL